MTRKSEGNFGCGPTALCWPAGIYSSGMISVFFVDSFDGPVSLPRAAAPAGAADHPGGRVAGHVQHGSLRNFQPGQLC